MIFLTYTQCFLDSAVFLTDDGEEDNGELYSILCVRLLLEFCIMMSNLMLIIQMDSLMKMRMRVQMKNLSLRMVNTVHFYACI